MSVEARSPVIGESVRRGEPGGPVAGDAAVLQRLAAMNAPMEASCRAARCAV